ncbi:unnamed protein product [Thelazia callipaeda]|uniref:Dynein_heavy domain-containing protein n=1 Tax=Thelazia callipaeda TaxID=103827 RepID=A0A0N5CQ07_THECL|nr:unnamed protein product [Thelazia callipaeda]
MPLEESIGSKHLPTLYENLRLSDQGLWSEFARSVNCETVFPPAVDAVITPFQKLIVIQTIRPERLHSAMVAFVSKTLNVAAVNPPPLNLRSIFKSESSENEPILIFVSTGVDPSEELEELVRNERLEAKFHQISMGQGQCEAALTAIRTCAKNGGWVCLKNVHLAINDLMAVEKEFLLSKRVPSFRLWLTSESTENLPLQLIQTSLKIIYESPHGMKNNMKLIYSEWQNSDRIFGAAYLQTLFFLAWLHTILQERLMFIPQAWLKCYEFSDSDLRVAKKFVERFIKGNGDFDWSLLRGLIEIVAYGGRIDNDFDISILTTYLKLYFNSSVIGANNYEIAQNILVPFSSNIMDYIDVIEKIPEENSSVLLGLPANISTTRLITEGQETIYKIRNLQIVNAEDLATDRNEWNKLLGPILSLWKRLISHSALHSMNKRSLQHTDDLILEIISLEYGYAVTVIQNVHIYLAAISRCLRGNQPPSPNVLNGIRSLMLHETPKEWQEVWQGPQDPVQYLTLLVQKANSVNELSRIKDSRLILSAPIKLGTVFRPINFFNVLRQLTSRLFHFLTSTILAKYFREKNITMDRLKLSTAWNAALFEDKTYILEISGICIQGALFENYIVETEQTSPSVTVAPNLFIAWIPVDAPDVYKSYNSVSVPLYATPERNEFIAKVQIPCTNPEQWIIASVALFLSN